MRMYIGTSCRAEFTRALMTFAVAIIGCKHKVSSQGSSADAIAFERSFCGSYRLSKLGDLVGVPSTAPTRPRLVLRSDETFTLESGRAEEVLQDGLQFTHASGTWLATGDEDGSWQIVFDIAMVDGRSFQRQMIGRPELSPATAIDLATPNGQSLYFRRE